MQKDQFVEEYELFVKKMELTHEQTSFFQQYELFTWQWWLLLALTLLPWVLWFMIRNREIQARLLLGGFFAGLTALVLDMIGTQAGLWRYGIKLVPSLPPLIPYDLALMPVSYMILQQISKTKQKFIIYAVVLSAATAFAVEPILKHIHVYYPTNWKSLYSFPIYFLIYCAAFKISSISGFQRYYDD
jgi:hypothetical protein